MCHQRQKQSPSPTLRRRFLIRTANSREHYISAKVWQCFHIYIGFFIISDKLYVRSRKAIFTANIGNGHQSEFGSEFRTASQVGERRIGSDERNRLTSRHGTATRRWNTDHREGIFPMLVFICFVHICVIIQVGSVPVMVRHALKIEGSTFKLWLFLFHSKSDFHLCIVSKRVKTKQQQSISVHKEC